MVGMIVQIVIHIQLKHYSEITQIIQTWVVTGGPLIASFNITKYVFDASLGQLKNGRYMVIYDDGGSYEGTLQTARDMGRYVHMVRWAQARRRMVC